MLCSGKETLEGDVDAVGINADIHNDASFLSVEFYVVFGGNG